MSEASAREKALAKLWRDIETYRAFFDLAREPAYPGHVVAPVKKKDKAKA